MENLGQNLMKYYRWIYFLFTLLLMGGVFSTPYLPLLCIVLLVLAELALKKKINGHLVKEDFRVLKFLLVALGLIIVNFLIQWFNGTLVL